MSWMDGWIGTNWLQKYLDTSCMNITALQIIFSQNLDYLTNNAMKCRDFKVYLKSPNTCGSLGVSHNKNHCDTCNTKVSLVHLDFCFPFQQRDSFQVNVNIIYSLIKEISCPFGDLRQIMAVRSVYFIKEKNGDIICRFFFF